MKKDSKSFNHLYTQAEKHLVKNNKKQGFNGKQTYMRNVKAFVRHLDKNFGSNNFKNLNDKHIISFVNERQNEVTTKTLLNELSAIRKLHELLPKKRYKNLIKNEDLQINRSDLDKNNEKTERAWTGDEYKKGLELAQDMNRQDVVHAMKLAKNFGLRINETTALSRYQLKEALKNGFLSLENTKYNIQRDVQIDTKEQRQVIESVLKSTNNERIFIKNGLPHGKAKERISRWIRNHRDKFQNENSIVDGREKVDISFHGLRHSYARNSVNF